MPQHVGYGKKVGDGSDAENMQETNDLGQYESGSTSPNSEKTKNGENSANKKPEQGDFPTKAEWYIALKKWQKSQAELEPEIVQEEKLDVGAANQKTPEEEPKQYPNAEKKESVLNEFGGQYGLDDKKVLEASDEELEELLSALSKKSEYAKAFDELSALEKQAEILGQSAKVIGVWKYESPNAKEMYENPKFSNTLQSKYDFLNSLGTENALAKVEELKKLEQASYEYANFIDEKIYPAKKALEEIGSGEADEIIGKFQDKNSPYSEHRKKNAYSVGYGSATHTSSSKLFGGYAKKQWDSMSEEEQEILAYYTSSYNWVQEPLQKKYYSSYKTPIGGFEKSVKTMDAALDKCSYDFDCWVQRGMSTLDVNGKDISELLDKNDAGKLIGTTFRNPAFMSCGSAKGTGFTDHKIILNLYCPRGTHMHYINPHSHFSGEHQENETIIGRGYEMRISKIEKKGYKIFLDVDIIVGSDTKESKDKTLMEAKKYAQ